jgi:proteasome lid subunit RPN8/RPN11
MTPVVVPVRVIAATLQALRAAGRIRKECVVLWLGTRGDGAVSVVEAHVPKQTAASDYFRIPRVGMTELFEVLRSRGLMVAAQVHTHPRKAFHSEADDRWALVRHEGALSLVLPYFARRATAETFLDAAAVFRLDAGDTWVEVEPVDVPAHVRLAP